MRSGSPGGGFYALGNGRHLTGVPLYAAHGYVERERTDVRLNNGVVLPIVRMEKAISLEEERRLPIYTEV
jgi:hypothetical protein